MDALKLRIQHDRITEAVNAYNRLEKLSLHDRFHTSNGWTVQISPKTSVSKGVIETTCNQGAGVFRRDFTLRDGYLSLPNSTVKDRRSTFTPETKIYKLLRKYHVDQFICAQPNGSYKLHDNHSGHEAFENFRLYTDGSVRQIVIRDQPGQTVQDSNYVIVDTKFSWYHQWAATAGFPEIGDYTESDQNIRTLVTVFTSLSRLTDILNEYRRNSQE